MIFMSVNKNISDYMSALGNRNYLEFDAAIIRNAIAYEYLDRKKIGLNLNKDKKKINNRIIKLIFEKYDIRYSLNDIILFKKCRLLEYEYRTGKCPFGFKEYKKRMGY